MAPDTQLTPHFWLSEFVLSETATRCAIDNAPPAEIVVNLRRLANRLEGVRRYFGDRVLTVTSGYRCEALNAAVHGAPASDHLRGLAADFVIRSYGTPYAICQGIMQSRIAFRQLIHEFGAWVHLAIAEPGAGEAREVLTITSAASGYRAGLHEVRTA